MEHTCNQGQKFDEILDKIASQKKLGEESYALADDTSKALEAHREAQQLHEKKLASFMIETNKIMAIVNDQLLPAFKREQDAEIAKRWIKEKAKSGQFWISVLVSIAAFLGILGLMIKKL